MLFPIPGCVCKPVFPLCATAPHLIVVRPKNPLCWGLWVTKLPGPQSGEGKSDFQGQRDGSEASQVLHAVTERKIVLTSQRF